MPAADKNAPIAADAPASATTDDAHADIPDLGFEDARDELTAIVATLEGGAVSLEESMRLWERGEALAAHCHTWLDQAQERVEKLTGDRPSAEAE